MDREHEQRPVVVGVDGAPATDLAVDWAADRATTTGSPLRLVAAYPHDGPRTRIARQHLEEATQRALLTAPDLAVESAAVVGSPRAVLLHEAQRAELLVVGSRRFGPVHHVFSPSTGAASVTKAACPVVVVRESASHSLPRTRVVVGIDGPASAAALRFAFVEASRGDTGLTAVHAWRLNTADLGGLVEAAQTGERVGATARSVVADLLRPLREEFPTVDVRTHVVEAHAVDELTTLSANARLLVVGSRGLGTLRSLVLGSVSREVIRRAHCPVAVVHPHSGVPASDGRSTSRATSS